MRVRPRTLISLGTKLMLLTACARIDMDNLSGIRPTEGGFVFRTIADTIYQEDDPEAERDRMNALGRFVEANALCPEGYEIVERQVVRRPPTFIGIDTLRDIYYTGTCRDG